MLESTRRDPVVACWTLSAQGPHPGHTRSPADVSGIALEVVPADLDRRVQVKTPGSGVDGESSGKDQMQRVDVLVVDRERSVRLDRPRARAGDGDVRAAERRTVADVVDPEIHNRPPVRLHQEANGAAAVGSWSGQRSEEHTSELQSLTN